ncbi:MAG TPA: hypothetical protein VKT81_08010 [Bryobacteraceae bacterium]|nr:hypothetical protein [Bryobacteraceae bacterium]
MKKVWAWILCLGFLLLLSLGFTEYGRAANLALISVRLVLVGVLSILFVREWWKYRHDLAGKSQVIPDAGDKVLRRVRRWFYDEPR